MTEKPTIKKREANKNKQKETKNLTETGTTEQAFVFLCESLVFWEKKSERAIPSFCSFGQEQREQFPLLQRARRAMKSDSLFCFGHRKSEKLVKSTNLKRIIL